MRITRAWVWVFVATAGLVAGCGGGTASGSNGPAVRLPPQWTPTPVSFEGVELEEGEWLPCNYAPPSSLVLGDFAAVMGTEKFPVRLREHAGVDQAVVSAVLPGDAVELLDGPVCMDRMVWWEVRSVGTQKAGWTPEGNAYNTWLIKVEE